MYYRAEYHPHKTKDMCYVQFKINNFELHITHMIEVQKIFKKWLIDNGYKTAIK